MALVTLKPPPSIEVHNIGQWEAAIVSDEDRNPFGGLTDSMVVEGADKNRIPARPPFAVNVNVGQPTQRVEMMIDTTSGSTWLIDVGTQAYEGELKDIAIYRVLGSKTAHFVTAAELRPRVSFDLSPLVPSGKLKGRVVADEISLAGLAVPLQPLMLAETVPEAAKSWKVAGVIGFGLHSHIIAPFLETWREEWLSGPIGAAGTPTQAALQPRKDGSNPARHIPRPVISIWPEEVQIEKLSRSNHSGAMPIVGQRPTSRLRIGLGELENTAWGPLCNSLAGWATEGHISVVGRLRASSSQGQQHRSRIHVPGLPQKWAAQLLVDSTTPFLGIPSKYFATFILAIIPPEFVRYCSWIRTQSSGLQVRCQCSIVSSVNTIVVEVASRMLALDAEDLWQSNANGEVCTILLQAIQDVSDTWHLGEPFLRRHAVTLDVTRRRLGFAPPPLPIFPEDIIEDSDIPRLHVLLLGGEIFAVVVGSVGATILLLVVACAMPAIFLSMQRKLTHRREEVGWLLVSSVGSDEEDGTTCWTEDQPLSD